MHEYGIAYDIAMTAGVAAKENKAKKVITVYVDVGELSMVNPEQVEFLFYTIVEDDPVFEGVVLKCNTVHPETSCPCGYKGNEIYVCPNCGALPNIEHGREIRVTNIEIETD